MSIKNKYTRKPTEVPKRKGNIDVLSQMINTEVQENIDTAIHKSVNTSIQGEKKVKKATFQMDTDLHKRLRTFAAMNDTTMVEVVEKALIDYMDKNE